MDSSYTTLQLKQQVTSSLMQDLASLSVLPQPSGSAVAADLDSDMEDHLSTLLQDVDNYELGTPIPLQETLSVIDSIGLQEGFS